MMVSDEEKRWLVVGIAMNKVAAPVLRNYIKQGMDTHYTNLDTYCSGLTTPCTLKTLTHHHVNTNPSFKHLKFQNVNNNLHLYAKHKNLYNYNINSSVDLAKLFLPDYLANFSAFDESLDMSAILRLLGFNNPAPIFPSPNPLISIQLSADDVRESVRNKWGHCNVTDWTEVLFNDCFSKLENLVRSLGLAGGMEKTTLDQLSDWQTKGCQLCMGHAVDQNLLSLVQQDVRELIKNFKKTEMEQKAIQESLAQLRTKQKEMQSSMRVQLEEHDKQLKAVQEWKEQQMKENKEILEKLLSVEKTFSEELLIRVEGVEKGLAETDDKVEHLEHGFARVDKDVSETCDKVKQLEHEVRSQRMKESKSEAPCVDTFDVKTLQRKLGEHYLRTAKVPTTVWSSVHQVDLEQIYTRLSWVKNEQTPSGSSQKELSHYSELFTVKNKAGVAPKRILVQGETGIGKTTFVKKLLVDWSSLDDAKMQEAEERKGALKKFSSDLYITAGNEEWSEDDEDMADFSEDGAYLEEAKMDEKLKDALRRKFELVVSINLKEVSKCQTLREVIRCSRLFPRDDKNSVDDLLGYVRNNQEKVLIVFDGYDEYRTGIEAEEKYGSRSNSPIYEIFHGGILRECTVLVTTRSSRADEIRGPADVQAEITGFDMFDREDFMRKMLKNQTQVDDLLNFLYGSNMEDLGRVPLLSLIFCLLWKEAKEKLMELPKSKTKLFRAITRHILQYSHRKHSSLISKLKEADYEEILAEIGEVALAGLLKGDLVFEFGELPEKLRGDESMIVGLLQLSQYGPCLEPTEMVSFIHKSIQEYLAAWYITYRCVPEGNLGGIEQLACTLEDFEAVMNVFQFVCGLSDDGAVKVFQHLTSVRTSDPTLDLSKTIPDVENESDVTLCDVTDKHERFSDLVYNFFQEVQSKAELLSHCFDCTGGIILVTRDRPLSKLIVKVNNLTKLAHFCTFVFSWFRVDGRNEKSVLSKSLQFLDCLHLPLRTECSEVITVADFLRRFQNAGGCLHRNFAQCDFNSILCFRDCQFEFYITELELYCDDHARLFTEVTATTLSVPSLSTEFCSEYSCLKYLTSLESIGISNQTGKALGAAIRNCKHLKRIEVHENDAYWCGLLELKPNSVSSLLPRFDNIITLFLDLSHSRSAAVDTFPCIVRKALKSLVLSGVRLTQAAAAALGRSLPEMSSLLELELTGVAGSVLQAEDMKALFGGLNKTLPLRKLTFSGFSVRGSLAPLTESFRFFPDLTKLELEKLNMDEDDQCRLLESLRFIPSLKGLRLQCEPSVDHGGCYTPEPEVNTDGSLARESPERLELHGIPMTPATAAALGRSLPELSSLQQLVLIGVNGSNLKANEIEALFDGFHRTSPLCKLTIKGFSVAGCIGPLTKRFQFFPNLRKLKLEEVHMNEQDQCCFLESLRFIPNVEILSVKSKPLSPADCCTAQLNTVSGLTLKTLKEMKLTGISLTPAVAAILGQSLPGMSSLQVLELTGLDGSIVQDKVMEKLFDGFNKTLPLEKLTFSDFSVRGCLAPLTKSFRFFPSLTSVNLDRLNLNEHDLQGLLESFQFICKLEKLSMSHNPLGHAITSIMPHIINLPWLYFLNIDKTSSEEDLDYIRETLEQDRLEEEQPPIFFFLEEEILSLIELEMMKTLFGISSYRI